MARRGRDRRRGQSGRRARNGRRGQSGRQGQGGPAGERTREAGAFDERDREQSRERRPAARDRRVETERGRSADPRARGERPKPTFHFEDHRGRATVYEPWEYVDYAYSGDGNWLTLYFDPERPGQPARTTFWIAYPA